MKAEGIVPKLATTNTLLDAQSGKVDQCAEMLGSTREEFGIEPDRTTSSTTGKDSCMMGHIDQAVRWWSPRLS